MATRSEQLRVDYAGDLAQLREAFSFAKDMLNTTLYGRAMMSMTLPDLENGPVCLAGKETGHPLILSGQSSQLAG